ncbi:MAG: peptidoglycan DD-metalloendopeptidase family protein, partial [Candidatus Omnitrophota bacterium]
ESETLGSVIGVEGFVTAKPEVTGYSLAVRTPNEVGSKVASTVELNNRSGLTQNYGKENIDETYIATGFADIAGNRTVTVTSGRRIKTSSSVFGVNDLTTTRIEVPEYSVSGNKVTGAYASTEGVYKPGTNNSLMFPVADTNARVSSVFGEWRNDENGNAYRHQGVVIAVATGTEVYAPKDGIVVYAGDWGTYGNAVVIAIKMNTANQYAFVTYGHLSKIMVRTGETVNGSQLVALSGNTGRSTGAHLHVDTGVFNWNGNIRGMNRTAFANARQYVNPAYVFGFDVRKEQDGSRLAVERRNDADKSRYHFANNHHVSHTVRNDLTAEGETRQAGKTVSGIDVVNTSLFASLGFDTINQSIEETDFGFVTQNPAADMSVVGVGVGSTEHPSASVLGLAPTHNLGFVTQSPAADVSGAGVVAGLTGHPTVPALNPATAQPFALASMAGNGVSAFIMFGLLLTALVKGKRSSWMSYGFQLLSLVGLLSLAACKNDAEEKVYNARNLTNVPVSNINDNIVLPDQQVINNQLKVQDELAKKYKFEKAKKAEEVLTMYLLGPNKVDPVAELAERTPATGVINIHSVTIERGKIKAVTLIPAASHVRAQLDGTAKNLGNGVVVISHGDVTVTYRNLTDIKLPKAEVAAGQIIASAGVGEGYVVEIRQNGKPVRIENICWNKTTGLPETVITAVKNWFGGKDPGKDPAKALKEGYRQKRSTEAAADIKEGKVQENPSAEKDARQAFIGVIINQVAEQQKSTTPAYQNKISNKNNQQNKGQNSSLPFHINVSPDRQPGPGDRSILGGYLNVGLDVPAGNAATNLISYVTKEKVTQSTFDHYWGVVGAVNQAVGLAQDVIWPETGESYVVVPTDNVYSYLVRCVVRDTGSKREIVPTNVTITQLPNALFNRLFQLVGIKQKKAPFFLNPDQYGVVIGAAEKLLNDDIERSPDKNIFYGKFRPAEGIMLEKDGVLINGDQLQINYKIDVKKLQDTNGREGLTQVMKVFRFKGNTTDGKYQSMDNGVGEAALKQSGMFQAQGTLYIKLSRIQREEQAAMADKLLSSTVDGNPIKGAAINPIDKTPVKDFYSEGASNISLIPQDVPELRNGEIVWVTARVDPARPILTLSGEQVMWPVHMKDGKPVPQRPAYAIFVPSSMETMKSLISNMDFDWETTKVVVGIFKVMEQPTLGRSDKVYTLTGLRVGTPKDLTTFKVKKQYVPGDPHGYKVPAPIILAFGDAYAPLPEGVVLSGSQTEDTMEIALDLSKAQVTAPKVQLITPHGTYPLSHAEEGAYQPVSLDETTSLNLTAVWGKEILHEAAIKKGMAVIGGAYLKEGEVGFLVYSRSDKTRQKIWENKNVSYIVENQDGTFTSHSGDPIGFLTVQTDANAIAQQVKDAVQMSLNGVPFDKFAQARQTLMDLAGQIKAGQEKMNALKLKYQAALEKAETTRSRLDFEAEIQVLQAEINQVNYLNTSIALQYMLAQQKHYVMPSFFTNDAIISINKLVNDYALGVTTMSDYLNGSKHISAARAFITPATVKDDEQAKAAIAEMIQYNNAQIVKLNADKEKLGQEAAIKYIHLFYSAEDIANAIYAYETDDGESANYNGVVASRKKRDEGNILDLSHRLVLVGGDSNAVGILQQMLQQAKDKQANDTANYNRVLLDKQHRGKDAAAVIQEKINNIDAQIRWFRTQNTILNNSLTTNVIDWTGVAFLLDPQKFRDYVNGEFSINNKNEYNFIQDAYAQGYINRDGQIKFNQYLAIKQAEETVMKTSGMAMADAIDNLSAIKGSAFEAGEKTLEYDKIMADLTKQEQAILLDLRKMWDDGSMFTPEKAAEFKKNKEDQEKVIADLERASAAGRMASKGMSAALRQQGWSMQQGLDAYVPVQEVKRQINTMDQELRAISKANEELLRNYNLRLTEESEKAQQVIQNAHLVPIVKSMAIKAVKAEIAQRASPVIFIQENDGSLVFPVTTSNGKSAVTLKRNNGKLVSQTLTYGDSTVPLSELTTLGFRQYSLPSTLDSTSPNFAGQGVTLNSFTLVDRTSLYQRVGFDASSQVKYVEDNNIPGKYNPDTTHNEILQYKGALRHELGDKHVFYLNWSAFKAWISKNDMRISGGNIGAELTNVVLPHDQIIVQVTTTGGKANQQAVFKYWQILTNSRLLDKTGKLVPEDVVNLTASQSDQLQSIEYDVDVTSWGKAFFGVKHEDNAVNGFVGGNIKLGQDSSMKFVYDLNGMIDIQATYGTSMTGLFQFDLSDGRKNNFGLNVSSPVSRWGMTPSLSFTSHGGVVPALTASGLPLGGLRPVVNLSPSEGVTFGVVPQKKSEKELKEKFFENTPVDANEIPGLQNSVPFASQPLQPVENIFSISGDYPTTYPIQWMTPAGGVIDLSPTLMRKEAAKFLEYAKLILSGEMSMVISQKDFERLTDLKTGVAKPPMYMDGSIEDLRRQGIIYNPVTKRYALIGRGNYIIDIGVGRAMVIPAKTRVVINGQTIVSDYPIILEPTKGALEADIAKQKNRAVKTDNFIVVLQDGRTKATTKQQILNMDPRIYKYIWSIGEMYPYGGRMIQYWSPAPMVDKLTAKGPKIHWDLNDSEAGAKLLNSYFRVEFDYWTSGFMLPQQIGNNYDLLKRLGVTHADKLAPRMGDETALASWEKGKAAFVGGIYFNRSLRDAEIYLGNNIYSFVPYLAGDRTLVRTHNLVSTYNIAGEQVSFYRENLPGALHGYFNANGIVTRPVDKDHIEDIGKTAFIVDALQIDNNTGLPSAGEIIFTRGRLGTTDPVYAIEPGFNFGKQIGYSLMKRPVSVDGVVYDKVSVRYSMDHKFVSARLASRDGKAVITFEHGRPNEIIVISTRQGVAAQANGTQFDGEVRGHILLKGPLAVDAYRIDLPHLFKGVTWQFYALKTLNADGYEVGTVYEAHPSGKSYYAGRKIGKIWEQSRGDVHYTYRVKDALIDEIRMHGKLVSTMSTLLVGDKEEKKLQVVQYFDNFSSDKQQVPTRLNGYNDNAVIAINQVKEDGYKLILYITTGFETPYTVYQSNETGEIVATTFGWTVPGIVDHISISRRGFDLYSDAFYSSGVSILGKMVFYGGADPLLGKTQDEKAKGIYSAQRAKTQSLWRNDCSALSSRIRNGRGLASIWIKGESMPVSSATLLSGIGKNYIGLDGYSDAGLFQTEPGSVRSGFAEIEKEIRIGEAFMAQGQWAEVRKIMNYLHIVTNDGTNDGIDGQKPVYSSYHIRTGNHFEKRVKWSQPIASEKRAAAQLAVAKMAYAYAQHTQNKNDMVFAERLATYFMNHYLFSPDGRTPRAVTSLEKPASEKEYFGKYRVWNSGLKWLTKENADAAVFLRKLAQTSSNRTLAAQAGRMADEIDAALTQHVLAHWYKFGEIITGWDQLQDLAEENDKVQGVQLAVSTPDNMAFIRWAHAKGYSDDTINTMMEYAVSPDLFAVQVPGSQAYAMTWGFVNSDGATASSQLTGDLLITAQEVGNKKAAQVAIEGLNDMRDPTGFGYFEVMTSRKIKPDEAIITGYNNVLVSPDAGGKKFAVSPAAAAEVLIYQARALSNQDLPASAPVVIPETKKEISAAPIFESLPDAVSALLTGWKILLGMAVAGIAALLIGFRAHKKHLARVEQAKGKEGVVVDTSILAVANRIWAVNVMLRKYMDPAKEQLAVSGPIDIDASFQERALFAVRIAWIFMKNAWKRDSFGRVTRQDLNNIVGDKEKGLKLYYLLVEEAVLTEEGFVDESFNGTFNETIIRHLQAEKIAAGTVINRIQSAGAEFDRIMRDGDMQALIILTLSLAIRVRRIIFESRKISQRSLESNSHWAQMEQWLENYRYESVQYVYQRTELMADAGNNQEAIAEVDKSYSRLLGELADTFEFYPDEFDIESRGTALIAAQALIDALGRKMNTTFERFNTAEEAVAWLNTTDAFFVFYDRMKKGERITRAQKKALKPVIDAFHAEAENLKRTREWADLAMTPDGQRFKRVIAETFFCAQTPKHQPFLRARTTSNDMDLKQFEMLMEFLQDVVSVDKGNHLPLEKILGKKLVIKTPAEGKHKSVVGNTMDDVVRVAAHVLADNGDVLRMEAAIRCQEDMFRGFLKREWFNVTPKWYVLKDKSKIMFQMMLAGIALAFAYAAKMEQLSLLPFLGQLIGHSFAFLSASWFGWVLIGVSLVVRLIAWQISKAKYSHSQYLQDMKQGAWWDSNIYVHASHMIRAAGMALMAFMLFMFDTEPFGLAAKIITFTFGWVVCVPEVMAVIVPYVFTGISGAAQHFAILHENEYGRVNVWLRMVNFFNIIECRPMSVIGDAIYLHLRPSAPTGTVWDLVRAVVKHTVLAGLFIWMSSSVLGVPMAMGWLSQTYLPGAPLWQSWLGSVLFIFVLYLVRTAIDSFMKSTGKAFITWPMWTSALVYLIVSSPLVALLPPVSWPVAMAFGVLIWLEKHMLNAFWQWHDQRVDAAFVKNAADHEAKYGQKKMFTSVFVSGDALAALFRLKAEVSIQRWRWLKSVDSEAIRAEMEAMGWLDEYEAVRQIQLVHDMEMRYKVMLWTPDQILINPDKANWRQEDVPNDNLWVYVDSQATKEDMKRALELRRFTISMTSTGGHSQDTGTT